MAKIEEMKFVDQHMEKIILGVCVLIMAYGVFQWVLSAPQRSEVPQVAGRVVPADKVDGELLNWVKRVAARKPSGEGDAPVYDYAGEIDKQRNPKTPAAITNWGNHRLVLVEPKRVKPPEGVRLAKIKDILETLAPVFTEIKGIREVIDSDGKGDPVDKLVFRGKADFPIGELLKAWNQEFRGSAMDEVLATVLAVEIERRTVLADGSFGPVTKVVRVKAPLAEDATPVEPVVIPEYTGQNADEVRKAIQVFSQTQQDSVLRPEYWKVWSLEKKAWTTPWIKEVEAPDPAEAAAPAAGAAKPAPAPVAKGVAGKIELLFHDADVTVQRIYSYRARLVFVNPLYTYDEVVYKGTPKDAQVRAIFGKWSPWVRAQAIPRTTQYFLTGASGMGNKQQLRCTIFTQSLGQVVAEKNFDIKPGRIIGGVMSKKIRNPVTGQESMKVVDFSTNATVVHAEFERKFVTEAGRPSTTRELICLEGGKLVSHILVKHLSDKDERKVTFNELQAKVGGQTP
ncbi:MAG: hypothetical protein QGG42_17105 [Phycisphaerae bacterium]|jgi:hypothetical protein|nr:hypothetical protein [Phycisphaerae bacterium]